MAIKLEPNNGFAHICLGFALYKKGKLGIVLAATPAGTTVPAYTQITLTVGN